MYNVCMKRTNLVLDEQILQEATRIFGVKTYSAAVNYALAEMIRLKKVANLARFRGSGIWQGDLSEMRQDQPGHFPGTRKKTKS